MLYKSDEAGKAEAIDIENSKKYVHVGYHLMQEDKQFNTQNYLAFKTKVCDHIQQF